MAQSKAFDSNAGSWPDFSGFKPLTPESKEIRVLQFDQETSTSELKFSMVHEDIHTSTFAALSYSWGAPVPPAALKRIVINGDLVTIRPILHSFMLTLASHEPGTKLWIDAVCINQNDTPERNHQIAMMGEIYAAAQKVFVWLGPGDDDTNYALDHIKNAQPETQFDPRQFSPCVEKIFKAAYWTRRWVIQEFALARDLYIACGNHIITWDRLVDKVSREVLANDDRALQFFENFKQLAALGVRKDLSLLQLMLRYQAARCIDRRDKAFALRAIAQDGTRLEPRYEDSVADVYFRLLSQLPTEKVLPPMRGYRWPHQAARQLGDCLLITPDDLLESISDQTYDNLFTTFEFIGTITAVERENVPSAPSSYSKLVKLTAKKRAESYDRYYHVAGPKKDRQASLFGGANVQIGDRVYGLRTSKSSPQGLFIAFPSDHSTAKPASILFSNNGTMAAGGKKYKQLLEFVGDVVAKGILRCSRNETAKNPKMRVLCHINRLAMLLLWSLDTQHEESLMLHYQQMKTRPRHNDFVCRCSSSSAGNSNSEHNQQSTKLELLPPFQDTTGPEIWSASQGRLWGNSSTSTEARWHSYEPPQDSADSQQDFLHHGRNDMSHAAEEGLISWMEYFHSHTPQSERMQDDQGRVPLSWAASSGRLNAIRKLLKWNNKETVNMADRAALMPLTWAVMAGNAKAVEVLLANDKVDPNYLSLQGRAPPLSWATIGGHTDVVEVLLASDRVDASITDTDFMSPLLWAAEDGHTRIVELLLATGKVDVNRKDNTGRTALSWAAGKGYTEIVKLLLADNKVDPDRFNGERKTPLDYAAEGKHAKIYKLLLATGRVRDDVHWKPDDVEQ